MSDTFSEGWYRVANLKTALRPNLSFRRQKSRGENWYVVYDPFTGNYFRLTRAYYKFVSLLDFSTTIDEIWKKSLELDPENAPGQKEVINLLVELNGANLLYFKDAKNSEVLFKKGDEKKKKEMKQQWLNILFMRFPLWNPNQWLTTLIPLWKILLGKYSLLLWFLVIIIGLKTGLENHREFMDQAEGVLAPGNLFLLYAGMILIKVFHEIGHAAMCKRFGGEVNNIGVMLLIFTPLPYVDATASWTFQDKWQRILVSSAGMMVELFLGALACLVWVYSPPGNLHALAYNMMFTATVSTIVFNINPLMRFDGYYILTDLIEIPNLYQKSREFVYRFAARYLFRVRNVVLPADSLSERLILFVYGIASGIYRVVLFVGIGLFIADRYLLAGMVLAVFLVGMSLLKPLFTFIKYLFFSPELKGMRGRAVILSACVFLGGGASLGMIPFSHGIQVPGAIETLETGRVVAEMEGRIGGIPVDPHQLISTGDVLLVLENPELDIKMEKVKTQLRQIKISEQQALFEGSIDIGPLERRKETLNQYYAQLMEQKDKLHLKAKQDGLWIYPDVDAIRQQWIAKGQDIGEMIHHRRFRFTAVIPQEDASDLFFKTIETIRIRLKVKPGVTLMPERSFLLPHAQEYLPTASLGWKGGGPVPLSNEDQNGMKSREPFYLLYVDLKPDQPLKLMRGLTGFMEIQLPAQSLGTRSIRYLRQFFQKRYHI